MLRLETLLALVTSAERPVRMFIETKHPTRYAGLVEKELVRSLRRFGLVRPDRVGARTPSADLSALVTVMSFAPTALRRIRLLAPSVPTVLLLERLLPARRIGDLPTGTCIAGPGLEVLRAHPRYVERAHRHGNQVYVWTVDEPADIAYVLDLQVDAVISNNPGLALKVLAGREGQN